MKNSVIIHSHDYWFKVVAMLQQNWALIETISPECCRVFFISDTSGVFDELEFSNLAVAEAALRGNGFARFEEDIEAQQFLTRPCLLSIDGLIPLAQSIHPAGIGGSTRQTWPRAHLFSVKKARANLPWVSIQRVECSSFCDGGISWPGIIQPNIFSV